MSKRCQYYEDYDCRHKERHLLLHKMLVELTSDYMLNTKKSLKEISAFELFKWSYGQTLEPTTING